MTLIIRGGTPKRASISHNEEEHFPADCKAAAPAPVPQDCPYYAASSFSGAYTAQNDTCPPPPSTSHDSDGYSTTSSYGPPPQHASYTPALLMPPPPRSVGPTPRNPPPSAPPSESDWNLSSGQSQALRAQYVHPGEFASSDLNDWSAEEGGVGSSCLPSAFVGQPVGIDQVDDVWIGDSGVTTRMTPNADLMYDTRPPLLP